MPISVITADLTLLALDAIVNAANPSLLGGGGVDGAIHRAAGPALLEACRALPEMAPGIRCPRGEARITPGFTLPAKYVIHTVGPVWQGGQHGEPAMLARCYQSCLALAVTHALRSVAFPAISCGVYGFPPEQAARIALDTLHESLSRQPVPVNVQLCCFDSRMASIWQNALNRA